MLFLMVSYYIPDSKTVFTLNSIFTEIVFLGKLKSMKHHKTEVDSINKNVDCGLMFDGFNEEFSSEDKIICYTINHVPQKTSWDPGF